MSRIYELNQEGVIVQVEVESATGRYVSGYLLLDGTTTMKRPYREEEIKETYSVRISDKAIVHDSLPGFEPHYNIGMDKYIRSEGAYRDALKKNDCHMSEPGEDKIIKTRKKNIQRKRLNRMRDMNKGTKNTKARIAVDKVIGGLAGNNNK